MRSRVSRTRARARASHWGGLGLAARASERSAVCTVCIGVRSSTSGGVADLGSDATGLGSDGAGLATDVGGLGTDFAGVGLDLPAADSLIGSVGLGSVGGVGSVCRCSGRSASLGGLVDGAGAAAGLGQAGSIGALSVPQSWADVTTAGASTGTAGTGSIGPAGVFPLPGNHFGAAPMSTVGSGMPKVSMPSLDGRAADAAVQKFGFRSTIIPQSPLAG